MFLPKPYSPLRLSIVCTLGLAAATMVAPQSALAEDYFADTRVTGGKNNKPCAFPSVVYVQSIPPGMPDKSAACTGTLVHPRLVLYAAHCGKTDKFAFSEAPRVKEKTLVIQPDQIEKTNVNPRYSAVSHQHIDWAYALLKEPITDIPITPVVAGCEIAMLQRNRAPVSYVGFSTNNSKAKEDMIARWANTRISGISGGKISVGGGGVSACRGDSGGPLMAQLPDGSWRTVGIASTLAGGCGTPAASNVYSQLRQEVYDWIEKETGVDLTPCYDRNGQPNPSLECDQWQAFVGKPDSPVGTRDDHCKDAKRIAAKDVCKVPDSGEMEEEEETTEEEGTSSEDQPEESGGNEESSESSTEEEPEETSSGESDDKESTENVESGEQESSTEEEPEETSSGESDDEDSDSEATKDDSDEDSSDGKDPKSKPVLGQPEGCACQSNPRQGWTLSAALFGLVLLRRRKS